MSFVSWLLDSVRPSVAARRGLRKRVQHWSRLAVEQLEDRMVLSNSVVVSVVDPPVTFYEGVEVNLTSVVDGAVGTPTYAWSVAKDGSIIGTGSAAELSFTPDDEATYAVSLSVTDTANIVSDNVTILVDNQPP